MEQIDDNATELNLNPSSLTQANETIDFNSLTDKQGTLLLRSLKKLLIRGPLNNAKNPYKLTFGGGNSFVVHDPIFDSEHKNITIPSHVSTWISYIIKSLFKYSAANQPILQLYNDIIKASDSKPFSRSSSTHYFYEHTLPCFIKRSAQKENITLKENIYKLSEISAQEIINELVTVLEKGTVIIGNSNLPPYKVSFFGGNRYKLVNGSSIIKVPEHVFQLLNALTKQLSLSKRETLAMVYDDVMIMMDSDCASRDESTKTFYLQTIPNQFKRLVEERQPQYSLPTSHL